MADYPNAPVGGAPFVALGGLGIREGGIYTQDQSGPFAYAGVLTYWGQATPSGPVAPVGPTAVSASTGVNPAETSYALYGHTIPVSVFGVGRIGGEIISGPWRDGDNVSGGVSYGVAADPTGTRTLLEIAFDSEVVWTLADGFLTEPFTFRFYPGTYSQGADPLETEHFGADAVAYITQMMLFVDDLPLAATKFQKFPYIACKISDGTGDDVNLGEAFTRLALSPWVGLTADQFETTGITDGLVDGGLIIASDVEFLQLIQQFGRFYTNWDILQTDKLRIVDRGDTVAPDIVLDKSNLMGQVAIARTDPNSIPRVLVLSTIDAASDYTIVPSTASFPRDAVNVSSSVKTETQYLPMIMDAATRASLVTYTKYYEEIARKKITARAMIAGLEIEPGDLVRFEDLASGISDETFKVKETTTGADMSVEIVAESFMDCQIPTGDPYWSYVVLLMGFEDTDGSTGDPGFTDESPAMHGTGTGGGQVDTSQFKFGSASLLPYVSFGASTDWELSRANSDQFTVEAFVRWSSIAGGFQVIVGTSFVGRQWFLGMGSGTLEFGFLTEGGTEVPVIGGSVTTGVWYHIAATKDATGKIRLFQDGVMVASATPVDSAFRHSDNLLDIGQIGLFGSNDLLGWVDEIRITKGIARYASDANFVVPTAAYPREGI